MRLFDESVTRGLRHSPGLLRRWISGARDRIYITSPAGIILDQKPGFEIDPERIQRVVDSMVRGIFHYEYKMALPKECPVAGFRTYFPDTIPNRQLVSMLDRRYETQPGGDFCYRIGATKEDPTTTVVVMVFYRKIVILTGTGNKNPLVTDTKAHWGSEVANG